MKALGHQLVLQKSNATASIKTLLTEDSARPVP